MGIVTSNRIVAAQSIPANGSQLACGFTLPVSIGVRQPNGIIIRGYVLAQLGTGATGLTLQCIQNVAPFTQVDITEVLTGLSVGPVYAIPFYFQDLTTAFEAGSLQHALNINQTGAPTAVGTVSGGYMSVEI